MQRSLSRRNILIAGASTTAVAAAATLALVVPQGGTGATAAAAETASVAPATGLSADRAQQSVDARESAGTTANRSEHRADLRAAAAKAAASAKAAAAHRAHLIAQANAEARSKARAAASAKAAAAHRAHLVAQANARAAARRAAVRAAHQAHLQAQANARAAARRAAARKAVRSTVLSGSPQQMAQQIVGDSGQFQCFSQIVSRESSWNPYAVNASSGAYGLVQALPGSKMASVGSDWKTNPATQIKWGLNYMNSRYGSPCGAWAFWQSHHWY